MLSEFIASLEYSRLGLVLAAQLQPLAALEYCWAVQSCLDPRYPHLLHPDNLVVNLDRFEEAPVSAVQWLFRNLAIERYPLDVFCWFSGLTDPHEEAALLVIFEKHNVSADYSRSLLCDQTLRHVQLAARLNRQERQYDSWLNEVRIIKENLLPPADHKIEGIDHAVHYRSCVGGGGDYYDLVDLRPALTRAQYAVRGAYVGVALCDVSGHGPGAAVEVAMLDAIVRTYRGRPQEGPADVLHYLNRHFFTRHLRGAFVTGVLCHYDAAQSRLRWTNAGHLPVIVLRGDGSLEVLDESEGIPVGIDRESRWEVHETALYPGDAILLMSDGITEAISLNNEQFGFDRVLALLQEAGLGSARDMVSTLISALNAHMEGCDDQDDKTLLFLRVLP